VEKVTLRHRDLNRVYDRTVTKDMEKFSTREKSHSRVRN